MLADPQYRLPTGTNYGKTSSEVFHSSLDKIETCWEWNSKIFPNGYGCFYFKGRYLLAHRVSYEWYHNISLSELDVVCHSCDNRKCVNPDHLIRSDQKFNIKDMMDKNRGNWASGENQAHSKLTESDVIEIRRLRYEFKLRLSDIAKMFNVSEKQISVVSRGIQWKIKKQ